MRLARPGRASETDVGGGLINPTVGFLAFLAATLACLGAAVVTGRAARRRLHVLSVAGAVASLATTIYFALGVGRLYDLASAGRITPFHLWLARVTTACYLLPIASGLATIWRPVRRRLHGRLAYLVLAMTLLTAVTGTIMLLLAQPAAGAPYAPF